MSSSECCRYDGLLSVSVTYDGAVLLSMLLLRMTVVYAPTFDTPDDVNDRFYDTLYCTLRNMSRSDKITLLGDYNARVGENQDILQGVIGHDMLATLILAITVCSHSAPKWVLPSQITSSSKETCRRFLGCIQGPNTCTLSTTSFAGYSTKCNLHQPCVGRSAPLITA